MCEKTNALKSKLPSSITTNDVHAVSGSQIWLGWRYRDLRRPARQLRPAGDPRRRAHTAQRLVPFSHLQLRLRWRASGSRGSRSGLSMDSRFGSSGLGISVGPTGQHISGAISRVAPPMASISSRRFVKYTDRNTVQCLEDTQGKMHHLATKCLGRAQELHRRPVHRNGTGLCLQNGEMLKKRNG